MIVMSEKESDDQNYKGLLQQYCQLRGVDPPTYGSAQCGSSHQPSWLVTVEYGDKNHKTSEPIIGSKKMAEQIANLYATFFPATPCHFFCAKSDRKIDRFSS